MATIGRDTIEVVYDGSGLPGEAEALGRETGAAAGEEHAKAFDEKVNEGFDKTASRLEDDAKARGKVVGEGFANEFEKSTGNDLGTKLRNNVDRAFDGIDKDFERFVGGLDLSPLDKGFVDLSNSVDDFDRMVEKSTTHAENSFNGLGDRLSANVDRAFSDLAVKVDGVDGALAKAGVGADRLGEKLHTAGDNTAHYFDVVKQLGDTLRNNVDVAFDDLLGRVDSFDGKLRTNTETVDEHVKKIRELQPAWGGASSAIAVFEGDIDGLGEHLRGNVNTAFDELDASFTKAMDALPDLDKGFKDASAAIDALRDPAFLAERALSDLGNTSNSTDKKVRGSHLGFRGLVTDLADIGQWAFAGLGDFLLGLGNDAETAGKKAGTGSKGWGSLISAFGNFDPFDNAGQLILLIIGLLGPLSVLAAAAAGGITILATALGGAIGGLGAFALILHDISRMDLGTLDKLPPQMKANALAFQDLIGVYNKSKFEPGKLFTGVQEALTNTFLKTQGLDTAIKSFTDKTLPGIESAAKPVASAIGDLFKEVLTGLGSKNGLSDIQGILKSIADQLPELGRLAGDVGGIISQLFIDATPFAKQFEGDLDKVLGKFLDFLKSPEGHDAVTKWLTDTMTTLGKVGDVIGSAVTQIGKLAANPENINNTVSALQSLADAAPGLAKLGQDLSVMTPAITAAIEGIANVAGTLGQIVDPVVSAIEMVFVTAVTFFQQMYNAVQTFVGQIWNAAGSIGTIIQDVVTGNFAKIPQDIAKAQQDSQKSLHLFTSDISAAFGNGAALFDTFSKSAQTASLAIAHSLGQTGPAAKDAAGQIANLAQIGGVSLSKLAKDKSWNDIARDLGLTGSAAKAFVGQFSDAIDGRAVKSVKDLNSQGKSNLDALAHNLGLTGSSASKFKDVVAAASGGSKDALSSLAKAKSLSQVEHDLGLTGAAATRFEAAVAGAMSGAGGDAHTAQGKFDDLYGSGQKLGKLSPNVKVSQTGAQQAKTDVQNLADAINGLKDKKITVTENFIKDTNGLAFGGLVDHGSIVAGGSKVKMYAGGGILSAPTWVGPNAIAGEAGLEALVPLQQPLSQVDPSVRELAAIARGVSPYATASGANGGSGATILPGAIVVQEAGNGRTTASAVLDRLAAKLGG